MKFAAVRVRRHGLVCLCAAGLAGFVVDLVGAQPESGGSNQNSYTFAAFNPSMASILVALVAALFFMGLCSIYLRHCNEASPASVGSIRRGLSARARRAAAARGLDRAIIDTLPTLSYSEVKEHKIGKGALECAVCLNEFAEDDTLRLLPKCDHVFHPDCIGAWLEQHVTCPVCRADLTQLQLPPRSPPPQSAQVPPEGSPIGLSCSRQVEISIQIDENRARGQSGAAAASLSPGFETPNSLGLPNFRSHSTGHSLMLSGENLERFTLRLPEGVKKEVMERYMLNRTRSYAVGEGGSVRGLRAGEGTSRGARAGRRLRATNSERWAMFRRALSMKSPRVGTEGVSGRATARVASFKCLEPKAADEHEADLIRNDGASRHV